MSPLEAARLGDEIGHTDAWSWLLKGLVIGFVVTGLVLATVATGGGAAVVFGAMLAGTASGGLAGMAYGATSDLNPKGPIITGSPDTFLGGNAIKAARAVVDKVECEDHAQKLIAQGSKNVFINNEPAARKTDMTECSGKIMQGQPDVFFGGPGETYLDIEPEVPEWIVTTLTVAAWLGAGIATGGAAFTVGIGAALGGFVGSVALGYVGGAIGREIGGRLGGERGAVVGEILGGLLGGARGGRIGGRLGASAQARLPASVQARIPRALRGPSAVDTPNLPADDINVVQSRMTRSERAAYQEQLRFAREGHIPRGPKTFYSSAKGKAAADDFVNNNRRYTRLERAPDNRGTAAGRDVESVNPRLESALDRSGPDGAAGQRLPWAPKDGVSSEGYGIHPWKVVSSRYGQAATGTAEAFVHGSRAGNVFRNQELPTLLRNPSVNRVNFRNDDGSLAGTWTRTGPNGTWRGKPVQLSDKAISLNDPLYSNAARTPIYAPTAPIAPALGGDNDGRP